MIEQISKFFTIEMIYLWLNIGVLPVWFLLVFFPQSRICRYFVTSIIPYIIFCSVYIYLIYIFYNSGYDFLETFNLYLGLNHLIEIMAEKTFLILFWVHFLAINLFCASWIVKDSQKSLMSRGTVFLPLILTYFVGPVGIFIYWIIRIFAAKKINLYD